MKKLLSVILIICIALMYCPQSLYADDVLPPEEFIVNYDLNVSGQIIKEITLNAPSAIVMEIDSGRILYEKNPYSKRAMASTTKIMTAILTIENANLNDIVTVSKRAATVGGSVIKLKIGEQIKVIDLLYGLMLESGNDAAVALAEHVAGTVEDFAVMMNDKAAEIGASNTSFVTPHGLDSDEHYTTAYDLAQIASYCMNNEMFRTIVSTAETYIQDRALRNTNDLLFTYEGATGIKTGFTNKAGRCLISSAKREGMEVIAVVLGCDSKTTRFTDSKKILDYAFNTYTKTNLIGKGDTIGQIEILKGKNKNVNAISSDSIILPLTKSEKESLEKNIMIEESLQAPCEKGKSIGKIYFSAGEENLAEVEVVLENDVGKKSFMDFCCDIFNQWINML